MPCVCRYLKSPEEDRSFELQAVVRSLRWVKGTECESSGIYWLSMLLNLDGLALPLASHDLGLVR